MGNIEVSGQPNCFLSNVLLVLSLFTFSRMKKKIQVSYKSLNRFNTEKGKGSVVSCFAFKKMTFMHSSALLTHANFWCPQDYAEFT